MSGRVEAIWRKRAHRGPMDPVEEASLVADAGIVDDANYGRGTRQVTIIEQEVFDRIRGDLPAVDPSMRRANFMVSGVQLEDTYGLVLTLGDVRVRIRGETRPCERMDAQVDGLIAALDESWGGGVYGVVLDDGVVRVGDAVSLAPAAADDPATAPASLLSEGVDRRDP